MSWEQIKKALLGESKDEIIARIRSDVKCRAGMAFHKDAEIFLLNKVGLAKLKLNPEEIDETRRNFAEDVLDYAVACVDPARGWADVSEIPEKMRSGHYKVEDVHRFISQHIYGRDGYFSIVVGGNSISRYTKYGTMESGFRGA